MDGGAGGERTNGSGGQSGHLFVGAVRLAERSRPLIARRVRVGVAFSSLWPSEIAHNSLSASSQRSSNPSRCSRDMKWRSVLVIAVIENGSGAGARGGEAHNRALSIIRDLSPRRCSRRRVRRSSTAVFCLPRGVEVEVADAQRPPDARDPVGEEEEDEDQLEHADDVRRPQPVVGDRGAQLEDADRRPPRRSRTARSGSGTTTAAPTACRRARARSRSRCRCTRDDAVDDEHGDRHVGDELNETSSGTAMHVYTTSGEPRPHRHERRRRQQQQLLPRLPLLDPHQFLSAQLRAAAARVAGAQIVARLVAVLVRRQGPPPTRRRTEKKVVVLGKVSAEDLARSPATRRPRAAAAARYSPRSPRRTLLPRLALSDRPRRADGRRDRARRDPAAAEMGRSSR